MEKIQKVADLDPDWEIMSTRGLQLGLCGFLEKLGTLHLKLPAIEPREDKESCDEDTTGGGTNSGGVTDGGKGPGGLAPAPPPLEELN